MTAYVGVPFTPSSNMINQGTAPAANFPNFYQIKSGPNGTGSTVYTSPSTNMNLLAAGLSGGRSLTPYTFSSVGTYSIMVCTDKASPADTNGVITESNEGNNCSNWATITVVPPLPDLTTYIWDATGDTLGQPTSITFGVYNIGVLNTGIGFPALLQVSADYGVTWQDVSVTNVPAIIQGGSEDLLTTSYTFPSAGFYVLRVCADMANGTDPGSITELWEDNNCGVGMINITAIPAPVPASP
jgi:hypothetical protein